MRKEKFLLSDTCHVGGRWSLGIEENEVVMNNFVLLHLEIVRSSTLMFGR